MKGILQFALTEIKLVLKDKSFYIWALLLPLFFIVVFSGGNGSDKDSKTRTKPALKITNHDRGVLSGKLIKYLKEEGFFFYEDKTEDVLRELVIPDTFSQKLSNHEQVSLQLIMNTDEMSNASISAKVSIFRAVFKFIALNNFDIKNPKKFLKLDTKWLGSKAGDPVPQGYIHQVPATIINFLMFNLLIFGGITVVKLRERGLLKRFITTPQGSFGIWLSLMTANLFVGMVVILMVFISSSLIFPVSFFNFSSLPVLLILVVYSISISALSVFLGSVLKKHEAIVGVSVLLANLFAALGGCWWPLELVPDFMKKIALFVPASWAVRSVDQLLFFKQPFSSVYWNLIYLLLFALLFSVLSVKFFNRQKQ
jgi:ABC-2 type transport system permease protein